MGCFSATFYSWNKARGVTLSGAMGIVGTSRIAGTAKGCASPVTEPIRGRGDYFIPTALWSQRPKRGRMRDRTRTFTSDAGSSSRSHAGSKVASARQKSTTLTTISPYWSSGFAASTT